jgi:hypothetical protein
MANASSMDAMNDSKIKPAPSVKTDNPPPKVKDPREGKSAPGPTEPEMDRDKSPPEPYDESVRKLGKT